MTLLSKPRWVSARGFYRQVSDGGAYLVGRRSAWAVLEARLIPREQRHSRHSYNMRLLIGRVDPEMIPGDAARIAWVWDRR